MKKTNKGLNTFEKVWFFSSCGCFLYGTKKGFYKDLNNTVYIYV